MKKNKNNERRFTAMFKKGLILFVICSLLFVVLACSKSEEPAAEQQPQVQEQQPAAQQPAEQQPAAQQPAEQQPAAK